MKLHSAFVRAAALLCSVAFASPLGLLPERAAAQEPTSEQTRAAGAYDAGVAAFRGGQYAEAGEYFLRANRLAPSPIALAQAVRSFRQAGSVRVAGTLALRLLAQEGLPDVLRDIAQSAITDAREFYVRVDVDCAAPCTIAANGAPQEGTRFFVVADQDVELVASFRDGATERQTVRGSAGEAKLVSFIGPAGGAGEVEGGPDAEPLDPSAIEAAAFQAGENPYRISRYRVFSRPRAMFFTVLAPTVIGTGMLTWAGLEARNSREYLQELEAQGTASPETLAVAENDFERDKRRAGWIAVETGAFVLATTVIAIFTDWTPHGEDEEGTQASVDVSPTGATLRLRRDF